MVNNNKPSFTLLEIMLVMFAIALIASMTLPRIMGRKPTEKWSHILEEVNGLVYFCRQQAISKQKVYRLSFVTNQSGPDYVQIEEENDHPEKVGTKIYTIAEPHYIKPVYKFPSSEESSVIIDAVYHEKEDLLDNSKFAHCYVIPNGLVQEVFVHLSKIKKQKRERKTLKMSPFIGKFEMLDKHIKPNYFK